MTKEENIATLNEHLDHWKRLLSEKICDQDEGEKTIDALQNAIKALEQEPCDDAVSRQAVMNCFKKWQPYMATRLFDFEKELSSLPPVTPQQKMGHCKDCKYFEYDSLIKVKGTKLIFAHEVCSMWGDGCKTKEDGYCFLFEPKMQEVEE